MEAMSTDKGTKTENEKSSLIDKSNDSNSKYKTWTTFQCLLFCLTLVIITNLASNMDRIVESIENSSSSSSSTESDLLDYPSRCSVDAYNTSIKSGTGDRPRLPNAYQFVSRSPSTGIHGMAASSQPMVAQTAIDIMKIYGGNAVDAAIAANIMNGLVEPTGNGIGGDLMVIVYDPETKKLYGYNGSGRSAMNFTFEEMLNISKQVTGTKYIPSRGPFGITVPGVVQGWCDLHEKFGNLSWAQLFQPAIDAANQGFPLTQIIAYYFGVSFNSYQSDTVYNEATTMGQYPDALNGWYNTYSSNNDNTRPPEFGEIWKNEALGNTFELIANGGCDEFYRGNLTERMVDFLESVGSPLTLDDFARHEGNWVDPVNVTYRDKVLVSELPDNMQGIAALQMLNMMELYDFQGMGINSEDYLHVNVEIKKLVYADRAKYYADDGYKDVCVPIDELISKDYALERNELIDLDKAAGTEDIFAGDLECDDDETYVLPIDAGHGDTIYLATADDNGMMVSLIQSNYAGFGSAITDETLGFTFQNRGALFSLIEGSANQYDVGKRPFHTIIPAFMHILNETDDEWLPYMAFGVMGGAVQPQGHVQIVSNIIDFGLNIQEAGDISRWTHDGSAQPTGQNMSSNGGTILLETGICQDVANGLIERGHNVRYSPNSGGYQGIIRDMDKGVYYGGTEYRKDGSAIGY